MNKIEIIKILEDWNFWGKDLNTGFERRLYLDILEKEISNRQIKVITGARRSGKSYIMRQLAKWLAKEKGIDKANVLIVNFEDPRFFGLNAELLSQIFDIYLEHQSPKGEIYIFLDEIQEVLEWEKWVRTMQELQKANIVISGSNAKLLSSELATVLTGRHIDTMVLPLSLKEFLKFKGIEAENSASILRNDIEIKSAFKEFMRFGSFPLVVLEEDKEKILLSYFDDVINKDLIKRYKIRKAEEIKNLIKFYLSNISNPITFNSLGKFLKMPTQSVERFSSYLEASYLLFFLKRFSFKIREQEKSPRKAYTVDVGLANTIGFQFSQNLGRIAENIVFLEIKRRSYFNPSLKVYYWKSLANEEVDFIIKENTEVKELIQVCFNVQDLNTKKREIRALLKAMSEFNLKKGFIITEDYEGEEDFGGKKIQYISLRNWLLQNV